MIMFVANLVLAIVSASLLPKPRSGHLDRHGRRLFPDPPTTG